MRAKYKALAVTTSGSASTPVALAPINTWFRYAIVVASSANTAPVLIGPASQCTAAVVSAASTGYQVGDMLVVNGGTFVTPVTLRVETIGAGGSVATVSIYNSGSYSVVPVGAVSVSTPTQSGATGATFTLTFLSALPYVVAPGQPCPLLPSVLSRQSDPLDAGDWVVQSTGTSQVLTLLYF